MKTKTRPQLDKIFPEIMTVHEAAEYLRLTPNTVFKWARAGRIPAFQFGKKSDWRFSKLKLDQMIASGSNTWNDPEPTLPR